MEDKTVTLPEQCKRTLDYIEEYGYITRLEAFADLGIANLTSVIHILRSNCYHHHSILEIITYLIIKCQ